MAQAAEFEEKIKNLVDKSNEMTKAQEEEVNYFG